MESGNFWVLVTYAISQKYAGMLIVCVFYLCVTREASK